MTNNNKIKYDFLNNKKWLYKEYVLKKQTISLIALKCNCSWPTVKRFIKKHNIKLRVRIAKPKIIIGY